jgi:hypothetical protein
LTDKVLNAGFERGDRVREEVTVVTMDDFPVHLDTLYLLIKAKIKNWL